MHSRFDTESRIAVTQAADIARELGHREVGPGHLLAGLLANPRGTAYAALRDHGLDLDSTRDLVAAHHVDAQSDRETQADHYEEDREALRAIGIDLDRVREAVRSNLGADLADGWAARSERGSRREGGRGRGGRGRHHHGRGHDRGRGRRGPRSRREDVRFSRELRAVLRDVRRSVLRDQLDLETREETRRVPGMTGARMLVALTRSDDPAVRAVLASSTGAEGLRAQAEAAVKPAADA
ncbi:MAG TPA: Clp protease N-terminal domain-containing protein [Nocardioides sp.]|uniref:Clp protease N-terminal domain-containing protein n=1 Tax=Nocardioides sp. TaxID=35761 RepID=UPI002E325B61|nr:Clp protease N-terminal domain-containing protein [Nocardioides sp.]HEX3930421.1 Clp protease N-terminal domain-containing protein [Nocardioides sp.]